ncbi:fibronectin type III domain-containing protein [Chengkuizengella sp. SCS-71B]|uniref:fibronectin type III domain-containing protein n=1 Tax=Chengkuizengella sp. SCS-71B TaxID=3115290 RepID=UPI0032C2490B
MNLIGKSYKKTFIFLIIVSMIITSFQFLTFGYEKSVASTASNKTIVGYWHNFDNGSTNIRLRDISIKYDVIQIAFAEPIGGPSTGNMGFTPYNATDSEFISDIDYLQSQGKKVLISVGGANGTTDLSTVQAKLTFISTMKNIIDKYGFDGMDIDLEGSSLSIDGGDTDFKNPTSTKIVHLIEAINEIMDNYGPNFMLTMAPETAYVQGGYSVYGGPWGAYLPVIHALRDKLTYLHVQHYNTGSMVALDGLSYSQGTADFHVAMAEMLLQGFPVAYDVNHFFEPLRSDQVIIGLPASPQAAGGGYTSPVIVQQALDYLIKGKSFEGNYVLRNPSGYPGFKGLMTWSINWDAFNNFEFSNSHRAYLDSLTGQIDTQAPTVPSNLRVTGKTSSSISLAWDASTDNVGVTGYIVIYGNTSINVGSLNATISGLVPNTSYTFTVKAKDAAGNVSGASNAVTETTEQSNDTTPPTAPTNLQVTDKTSSSIDLNWSASTDNEGVTGYIVSYNFGTIEVTETTVSINGLTADTTYTFTVTAKDAAGNISDEASIQVTTDGPNSCPYPAWDENTEYVGGVRVTYNGKVYESKWWTVGEFPDQSGEWGVWKYISTCDGGGGEIDNEAPSVPSNLQITGKSSNSVSLAWNASTDNVGVTGYTITYDLGSVGATNTTTTINGLNADTTYTFSVTAKDAAGNESEAVSIQATTDKGDPSGAEPWEAGINYSVNDEVTYNGNTYYCIQAHTSQIGWEPPNVPALWGLK